MLNEPRPWVDDLRTVVYPNIFSRGASAMTVSAPGRDSIESTMPPRCVRVEMTSPIYSDGADTCTFITGCMSTAPASAAILSKAMAAQDVNANGVDVFSS